jgi:RNA polymerase sigma-70 factor (sigma-E family)
MTVGEPSEDPRVAAAPSRPVAATNDPPAGGRAVHARVFRDEYPRLVALARLLVDRQVEAEEIVQEAFVRALAGWERLEHPDDPLPYVRRTVVNLAHDGLRRRRTVRRSPEPVLDVVPPADAGAVLDEDHRELLAALRALSERQRECVVLRHLLDLSTAETAATLGITDGSVKTHVSRGLAALEAALEGTR